MRGGLLILWTDKSITGGQRLRTPSCKSYISLIITEKPRNDGAGVFVAKKEIFADVNKETQRRKH